MAGPVSANGLLIVHRGNGAIAAATAPDVCKTPSSAGPVPIPYPNIAVSADLVGGTLTVIVNGQPAAIQTSKFARSTGDEAGCLGGVGSQVFMGPASFITFSHNVFFEGKPVVRHTDKMIMNNGNTFCAAGVLVAPAPPAACPPPASGAPPPEPIFSSWDAKAPKLCSIDEFKVKCAHGGRGFTLDGFARRGELLQVISEDKPDSVEVTLLGQCGFHSASQGKCPSVEIWKNGTPLEPRGKTSLVLPRPDESLLGRVLQNGFFDLFSLSAIPSDLYAVCANTCGGASRCQAMGTYPIKVQVFQNFSCKGELQCSYGYPQPAPDSAAGPGVPARKLKVDPRRKFVFTGKLELVCGDSKLELCKSFSKKDSEKQALEHSLSSIYRLAQRVVDVLSAPFESMEKHCVLKAFAKDAKLLAAMGKAPERVNIEWPKLVLGANVQLAEKKGGPQVGLEGNVFIKFDPLIGFDVSMDLLEWLIRIAAPGVGNFLVAIKRMAAGDGVSGPPDAAMAQLDPVSVNAKAIVEIRLTVGGKIFGELAANMKGGIWDPKSSCLGTNVEMGATAKVHGEVRIWMVQVAAGAEIALKSADGKRRCGITGKIGLKRDAYGRLESTGTLEFSGMALFYILYAELHKVAKEGEKGKKARRKHTFSSSVRKSESKELAIIFNPHTWTLF